ncbi:MAG TPA: hypothetical protein PLO37_04775 [Candidatus Hydrogenedentes bacterium]|nr:hypothetical protein [Candidatus Hydrogenedentota bacterium]HPG66138.1 hypothetical protein [Candidatus Hydrogenedentota bacterium]
MTDSQSRTPALKGALHTHTSCSDGDLAPMDLLRVYRDLDFDFVALTDHDFLIRPNAYDDVPDEFEGMLVLRGVEKTVFARGYVHVIVIRGDLETLRVFAHPGEYDLSVGQVVERIDEIRRTMPIDAIEVTAKGYYTPEYDCDAIPFPKVASDDAHTRGGCGRAWIEVGCHRDRDAIIQAIKSGSARVCYKWTAHQSAWANNGGVIGG